MRTLRSSAKAASMPDTRTILVIDDESLVCDVISGCLEDWSGTRVDYVLNAADGAHKLRGSRYKLAIIDGLLAGITGVQLAELAVNENIPVLLTTGHPDLIGRLEEAAFPYLSKPFALESLLAKSQAIIAESRDNIRRVRRSLEVLRYRAQVLSAVLDDSKRLMLEAHRTTHNARMQARYAK